MTHAWFDISAGVAGDMLLGALLDAGADPSAVQRALDAVAPGSIRLETEEVLRAGQRATKAHVRVLVDDPPHRTWSSLREDLTGAALADETRTAALAVFGRLAEAEGHVHGIDPDRVHFHEVGALDSIADVVGVCEALRLVGVRRVTAGPVALGSGRIRAAHGDIPVPVPAVAQLALGWQVLSVAGWAGVGTPGAVGELATPTGVALIRALAAGCEPLPSLTLHAVGVGAGGREVPGRPNVVRVFLGDPVVAESSQHPEMVELMANVDDLDPRVWPSVLEACLAAGAADAWLVPIQMKKGRPAFTLHALAARRVSDAVARLILEQTTTLGVREVVTSRHVLDRAFVTVDLAGHALSVKVGSRDGVVVHAAAEHASLASVARTTGRPEAELVQRAAAAIVAAGLVPGAEAPVSPPAD